MINTNKVRGRMVEKGMTQQDAANYLGIAQATFSQKINNVRPMDLNEAEKLAEFLDITDSEFALFFLAKPVA